MATDGLLVSTTAEVPGYRTVKYCAPLAAVCSRRFDTGQVKTLKAYNEAARQIQRQAGDVGANAVVGLSVEIVSAAGWWASAHTVVMLGTAVLVEPMSDVSQVAGEQASPSH